MHPARTPGPARQPLPLDNGDRLSQAEFHRRYRAYADDVKCELIEGTVFMASPTRVPHGAYHVELTLVLGLYKASTPGIEAADNVTVILGEESEPQPDLLLRLDKACGGQSEVNAEEYLVGAPELVVEVAHSSAAIDLHGKRRDYRRAGVLEYVVFAVAEGRLHWFHHPSKRPIKPDRRGVYKSRVFPGLWIEEAALRNRETARLVATLQQGLASPEHAAFVEDLRTRRQG